MASEKQRKATALIRLADSVRRLIRATVVVDAPTEALAAAAGGVDRLVEDLSPMIPDPPPPRYAGPHEGCMEDTFPYDYVLGRCNPLAPPIAIEWEDPKAVGRVTLSTPYEGPPGCVHGGVIAASFDQVLNAANMMRGTPGPTVELTIRYRRPTPLNEPLLFEAWHERTEGQKLFTTGRLSAHGQVTAEAAGVFVMLSYDRVMRLRD